jgi:hypothetical protein
MVDKKITKEKDDFKKNDSEWAEVFRLGLLLILVWVFAITFFGWLWGDATMVWGFISFILDTGLLAVIVVIFMFRMILWVTGWLK